MLKVQRYSSIFTPGAWAGTRKAVIPLAVAVLAAGAGEQAQWVAACMPVVHIFSPSIRQPLWPWCSSRTARVSMKVASEPWLGSVRPKVGRKA
jgi:hypothetical protein